MVSEQILKVPFETSSSGSNNKSKKSPDLLLHIQNPSSNPKALGDLTFSATDGAAVFTGSLPVVRIAKALLKDAEISIPHFEAVLKHILLQQPLPSTGVTDTADTAATLKDIVLCAVWNRSSDDNAGGKKNKNSGVKLRFKREVQAFNQYVAEIVLGEDNSVEIDVCEWTRLAIDHGAVAEREMNAMRTRLEDAEKGIEKVKTQLEELLNAKREDEQVLLEKFAMLLDSKKARIRMLESRSGRGLRPWPAVDEGTMDDDVKREDDDGQGVVAGKSAGKGKGQAKAKAKGKTAAVPAKAGPSRTNKRKQSATQADSAPAFETMQEVPDNDENGEQAGQEAIETDRESLQESEIDAGMDQDSDDLDEPQPSKQASKSKPAAKLRSTTSKQHTIRSKQVATPDIEDDQSTDDEL